MTFDGLKQIVRPLKKEVKTDFFNWHRGCAQNLVYFLL
jgi:hypothetical protein